MRFLVGYDGGAMSNEPEDDFDRTSTEAYIAHEKGYPAMKKKTQKSAPKKNTGEWPNISKPKSSIPTAESARAASAIGVKRVHEELRRKRTEEQMRKEEEFNRFATHILPEIRADFDRLIRETCNNGLRAVDLPLRYDHAELLATRIAPELHELGYEVSKPFVKDLANDTDPEWDGSEDNVWHIKVSW
jgi:hypothetical protein